MATVKAIRLDFDPSNVGEVATLTDSQVRNFSQQSQRLRQDLTYVICPQWVHEEKIQPVNGYDKSNRIFALGVNEQGVPVMGVTLSVNGLRARHYGRIDQHPGLKIEAVINQDGLKRIGAGASQTNVFSSGALPIKVTTDKRAYITRPFAFRVNGMGQCYTVAFTETSKGSGKWNVNTYNEGGKEYVEFRPQSYNDYVEVDNVPVVSFDFVPEKFRKDLPK